MRVIGREASDLDGKNVDITLGADDAKAKKKFVELNLMGDRFGKRVFEARAGLDDKGAILKLDKLEFKLRKLTERKYDAKVGIDGFEKSMFQIREMDLALDRFGRKHETATARVRTSTSRSLFHPFGGIHVAGVSGGNVGGGGVKAAEGAANAGASGASGFATSPGGIAAIAGLATLVAALTPAVTGLTIGLGTAGIGTFGALTLGQTGTTKIAADQKKIAADQRAGKGTLARSQLPAARAQLARDEHVFGPLTPLTPAFSTLKNTGIEVFAKAVQPLAKALLPILKQVGSFLKSQGPALSKMFSASIPFLKMFVKIFEGAAKQLFPAFTQIMKQLGPLLPGITKSILLMVRGFVVFLDIIGKHMKGSAQTLSVVFQILGKAISVVGVIVNLLIGGFKILVAFFKGGPMAALKELGHAFGQLWTDLKKAFPVLGVVEHGFKRFFANLGGWFADAWRFIRGIWDKIWNWVSDRVRSSQKEVGRIVSHIVTDLHNWFFDIWHFINQIWQKTWNWIKKTAEDAWHRVTNVVKNLWHDVTGFFKDLWRDVKNVWDTVWHWVKTRAEIGWRNITDTVRRIWHDVVGFFKSLWHDVKSVWDTVWNWVKTRAETAWRNITDTVKRIWHDVTHFFGNIWNDVKSVWDKLWNWVKTRIETGWHDASGIAKNLWQDVVKFFHNIKTDVTNIWNGVWDFVKRTGKDAINWVIDRINTFINVVDKVASFIPGVSNHLIPDIPHLAMGGWVGGSGGPTQDNQPAMLSSGERVLSHAEIANIGGRAAVDALAGGPGTGGPTHFAGGGTVPPTNNIPRFGAIPKTETLGGLMHDIRTGLSGPAIAIVHKMQNVADALIAQHEGHSGITAMVGGVAVELIQKMVNAIVTAIQGASGGGGTTGMVNPYKKIRLLTPERIDMGVDFGGSGIIGAIGPGVIGQTMNSGWPGGAFIEEKLTGGPYAGKFVYEAENIVPIVKRGQKVKAGQAIGRMTGGIEAGWGAGTGGLTMAAKLAQQAHHGDPGGNKTAMGMNFEQLLVALGVPKAPNFGAPSVGKVPPGFYSKNAGTGTATAGSALHNGLAIFQYLKANLFGGDKIAAAGAIASIYGESGWNPDSQGTGGRGLIGWTPPGTLPNSAFTGNATHDLNAQLPLILKFVKTSGDQAAISAMKRSKTILQAATIWDHSVERAGIFDVHGAGLSLAKKIMGMKHGGVIREEIFGIGRSGQRYRFGEDGVHERVTPVRSGSSGEGDTIILQVSVGPYSDPMKVAKEIHQGLREYRRSAKGGQKLGFDT